MKKGDLVKFIGCSPEQCNWGACDFPATLVIDDYYVIEAVEPHTYHTKIRIEGHNGRFNSVCFV